MGLHGNSTRWWRLLGAPALAASLVVSAVSIAIAARDPRYSVVSCVALVPLFAAIRLLKPAGALAGGALWGGYLYFGLVLPDAGRITSPVPGFLFLLLPALYAGVASALTGRFGFQPLLLALGWLGPELLLHRLASAGGLPAQAAAWSGLLGACGRIFGWLTTVALIVYVNAKLVAVLGSLRGASRQRVRTWRARAHDVVFAPGVVRPRWKSLHPASPRAPPLEGRETRPQRPGGRFLDFLGESCPGRHAGLA